MTSLAHKIPHVNGDAMRNCKIALPFCRAMSHFFVDHIDGKVVFFMSTTYKRPKSDEERERRNRYGRAYRAAHPDSVRRWRDSYTLRRADRLRAEQAQQVEGGVDR